MIKSTVSVLAAALLLSPVALAQGGKMVTLTHTYDTALVSSEDGAAELLADLTSAAKRACTSRAPVLGARTGVRLTVSEATAWSCTSNFTSHRMVYFWP